MSVETSFFHLSLSLKWLLSLPEFKFLREHIKCLLSLCPLSLSHSAGPNLSPPSFPPLPAVFLNIGICVSAAGLVDQLGRSGGSRSKATRSMSIGAQLSFKAPGCRSVSLIRPHWDRRNPQQLMLMCCALDSLSSRAVCVHKHSE